METENPLRAFVEVQTLGTKRANLYLANGYTLLSIQVTTRPGRLRSGTDFVLKEMSYVVGRTEGVAHYDLPPLAPKAVAEPQPVG